MYSSNSKMNPKFNEFRESRLGNPGLNLGKALVLIVLSSKIPAQTGRDGLRSPSTGREGNESI